MYKLGFVSILSIVLLAACGDNDKDQEANPKQTPAEQQENADNNHENMDMTSANNSEEVPLGMKKAEKPKYEVGSEVVLKTDHMEGMNGATAKIVGAYDTTVYAVTYMPTNGGEEVKNHKWLVQEEMENANDTKLTPGTEVTITADHMEGMNGATATIDSANDTTVYMVDYKPTNGGEEVKNHKWVTEEEITEK